MLTRAEVEAMLVYVAAGDPKTGVETRMTGYIQTLARDWLAMEAVVARLPKTADGAYFLPDIEVWVNTPDFNEPQYLGPGGHVSGDSYFWCSKAFRWKDCYSTREAAALAKNGGK